MTATGFDLRSAPEFDGCENLSEQLSTGGGRVAQETEHGPRRGGARCDCGHVKVVHQHARVGLDCGVCGPSTCPEYRRRPLWARFVRRHRASPLGAAVFDRR